MNSKRSIFQEAMTKTKNDEENKNEVTIDDVEFRDAVISIPANAIFLKQEVKVVDDNGDIATLEASFVLKDIQDMFDLFEKTIAGDYPKYILTEKGLESVRRGTEVK